MLRESKRRRVDIRCGAVANACDRLGGTLWRSMIFLGVCFLYTTVCGYLLCRFRDYGVPVTEGIAVLLVFYTCVVAIESILLLRCILMFLTLAMLRIRKSKVHRTTFSWGRGSSWIWALPGEVVVQEGVVYSCLWVRVPLSKRLILEVKDEEVK